MKVINIETRKIRPGKNHRFEHDASIGELSRDIERHGLLHPIVLRRTGKTYQVVCGHRRLQAVKMLGEPFIEAYVKDDLSASELGMVTLSENIHRENLSPAEIVKVLDDLKARHPGVGNYSLGKLVGKTEGWVKTKYVWQRMFDKLTELGLDPEVAADIPEGHMRRLQLVKDPEKMVAIAKKIKPEKLTTRDVYRESKIANADEVQTWGSEQWTGTGPYFVRASDPLKLVVHCKTGAERDRLEATLESAGCARLKRRFERAMEGERA